MKFYFLLLSFFIVGLTSCGDSCDAVAYAEEVSDQSSKINTSAAAYTSDPTDSTLCMEYAAEFEALIDIYEKYQDCDDINVNGTLDDAITSTQASIDALNCN